MEETGMIQADLSRHSNLNPSTVSLIRNNHRSPSYATLQAFADMFHVKVSEFIAAGE
jgi:transcriptional regulator with XRE-family HTH domain